MREDKNGLIEIIKYRVCDLIGHDDEQMMSHKQCNYGGEGDEDDDEGDAADISLRPIDGRSSGRHPTLRGFCHTYYDVNDQTRIIIVSTISSLSFSPSPSIISFCFSDLCLDDFCLIYREVLII